MKNIHVLPTDKPSRFVRFFTNKYHLCKDILPIEDEEQYQNIYITSDEEIKDCNCYVINAVGVLDKMNVFKPIKVTEEIVRKEPLITYPNGGWCKKIILTTDTVLINDGVQHIPDEFLEWFVKNTSCEMVEISPYHVVPSYLMGNEKPIIGYKIIIPKEEPKQYPKTFKELFANTDIEPTVDASGNIKYNFKAIKKEEPCTCTDECLGYLTKDCKGIEEPKQETLEEYIERETKSIIEPSLRASAITFLRYGAKWQQEQEKNKYSEQDMIDMYDYGYNNYLPIDKAFEQFKKK